MDLDVELYALNENAKIEYLNSTEDGHDGSVSRRQVQAVIILMRQGIKDDKSREVRLGVLNLLLGRARWDLFGDFMDTTNKITGPMANTLIDLISKPRISEDDHLELTGYGKELLEECEERFKEQAYP